MESQETPFAILIPPEFYEDLDRRIKQAVAAALQNNARAPRYLTRKEVCQAFNISLPTLSRYCKRGILTGKKIGSRILFDETALTASLKNLQP